MLSEREVEYEIGTALGLAAEEIPSWDVLADMVSDAVRERDQARADLAAIRTAVSALLRDLEPADLPGRGAALLAVRAMLAGEETDR